ncbi:MAG: hypothetical protein IJU64_06585 [Bacilli bacterium]|nr:hypothetical protein [Bacilli bacterium]
MIMIVGATHDDVLYFDSIMTGKHTETYLDRYKLTLGNIFNQEVCLVEGMFTNYLSSAIMLGLIQKYLAILVIGVGRCTAFSKDFKAGDIAISGRVFSGDVDLSAEAGTRMGQIPGFPPYFLCQEDIVGYLSDSFEKRGIGHYAVCNYVSTNVAFTKMEQLKEMTSGEFLYGAKERVVLETNMGGIATACYLGHVPFVGVKTVSRFLDKAYTVEDYATTLRHYIDLGKGIVTTIGDIGRADLLGGK